MRLEIKNVSAEYSGKQIITNVNFSVADGEFVSILGESGSGK